MQLTRFDRWLLESFIQETHIYTLSPPASVPRGIRELPMPDTPGRRYQHHFVARSEGAANRLITTLRENGQMFSTQVVDRQCWYTPFIAPKGKSVTWRLVWILLTCVGLFYATMFLRYLLTNPEFIGNLKDAIKILSE
ncbi:hypothetical protein OVA24_09215 [Luteolibacter sp. SL250]|uniref:hypothetical protein n=1 Tax=Luteolibacter sp. SL250 TaxID=2995170 RepID=UPI00226F3EAF|nr:hypothetical protein [Luteolibacter sp. SL250]WAC21562.1 hypothetical protein OVA24_09215 [Luteolibacter sp. SL250]